VRKLFCTVPELCPEIWDFVEPARRTFEIDDVVSAIADPKRGAVAERVAPSFYRKTTPGFYASIHLHNGPVFRPCHNSLVFLFDRSDEHRDVGLPSVVSEALTPDYPDYGYVALAARQDQARFDELSESFTAAELLLRKPIAPPFIIAPPSTRRTSEKLAWYHPDPDFMLGPHGFLWDIVWFTYFGRPYVELIGESRLRNAGWARVETIGDGLGCYATEAIDDNDSYERRAEIRHALEEFLWTKGCRREEKRAPVFDFTEQLAAAPVPPTSHYAPGARSIQFAGLSEQEKQQAIRAIEDQTGMMYDEQSGMLLPRKE